MLVRFPFVFAYFLGLMLRGAEADEAYVRQIAITELLVSELFLSLPGACNGASMSKKPDVGIVADGFGVLIMLPDRLAGRITDKSVCSVTCKTGQDHSLAYVKLCHGQELDWSSSNFEGPLFANCWCTGDVIGLRGKGVPKSEPEVDRQFIHH